MPQPNTRVQNAQIIVDLGDRPHRRPGVPAAGFLLDRDRRAQPVDPVDLGFGHLAQELSRIARQTLDVPPLTFGIKRIKRQRTLARTRDTGQADEFAPRQDQRDIAQIMLARARITMPVSAIPGGLQLRAGTGDPRPAWSTQRG